MNYEQRPVPELRRDEWLLKLRVLVNVVEKLDRLNDIATGKKKLIIDTFSHIKHFKRNYYCF